MIAPIRGVGSARPAASRTSFEDRLVGRVRALAMLSAFAGGTSGCVFDDTFPKFVRGTDGSMAMDGSRDGGSFDEHSAGDGEGAGAADASESSGESGVDPDSTGGATLDADSSEDGGDEQFDDDAGTESSETSAGSEDSSASLDEVSGEDATEVSTEASGGDEASVEGSEESTEDVTEDSTDDDSEGGDTDDDVWIELEPIRPSDFWGNDGTTHDEDFCPAGEVLVGFAGYLSQTNVEAIQGLCGTLEYEPSSDRLRVVPRDSTTLRGRMSGNRWLRECPEDQVVHGFTMGRGDAGIHYLRVSCAAIRVLDDDGLVTVDHAFLPGIGNPEVFTVDANCWEVGVSTGPRTKTRQAPTALGLHCAQPRLRFGTKLR